MGLCEEQTSLKSMVVGNHECRHAYVVDSVKCYW